MAIIKHVITESDFQIKRFSVPGEDFLVNSARFAFDRRERPLRVEDIQGRDIQNYLKTLDLKKGYDDDLDDLVLDSFNIYGLKEVQDTWEKCNWIDDPVAVRNLGNYIFIMFGIERVYIDGELPYFKNTYKDIQQWDVIRLSHVDISSDAGTETTTTTKNPVYSGTEASNYFLGYTGRRARSVDMRVIGRTFSYRDGEYTLKLSLMTLDNESEVY